MAMDKTPETIETTLAFQERKLEELSEVIYRQQRQIDSLERDLNLIREQFRNLSEDIQDKRPPHY